MMGTELPNTLEFLECLGFDFGLDWDEEVQITAPPAIDCDGILRALKPFEDDVRAKLRRRARRARSQCIGGPLNGQPLVIWWGAKQVRVFRIGRAKWAIYVCFDLQDGRSFFHGYQSSEAKARRRGCQILRKHRAAQHKQEGD